jgi:large subunit ribosomal protein L25
MTHMDLSVKTRTKFGKATKSLRKTGVIPAELYGRGIANKHLSVDGKVFTKLFREAGEHTVINLVLEDGTKHPALVHDVERDYLTSNLSHVDFYEVRMDEVITAPIPFEFVGEAPAVKEFAGVFTRVMEDVEVEALPASLPKSFVVDISGLKELNQSIYLKDIKVPAGVKVLVDGETVIATVSAPRAEEEILAPVGEVDLSAVKVESEEKAEARAKDKEAAGDKKAE